MKKNKKTKYYSPRHSSYTHKTFSQNGSRSKQFVAGNCQQSMNGDWNPSNNLKKTCLDFTLAIGVQREMGLGFFRDLDMVEMGLRIFKGSKVEKGREFNPFLGF